MLVLKWRFLIIIFSLSFIFFFFSSRRRHTSWPRDWSSDVCSSDLVMASLVAGSLLGPTEDALALSGQGLRDTTRIADSDPRLWVEILGANAAAVTEVLEGMRDRKSVV